MMLQDQPINLYRVEMEAEGERYVHCIWSGGL